MLCKSDKPSIIIIIIINNIRLVTLAEYTLISFVQYHIHIFRNALGVVHTLHDALGVVHTLHDALGVVHTLHDC